MVKVPWYKKCLGYVYPIIISRYHSDKHPNLKIRLFQGQFQLESEEALYSDGWRYSPFRMAYDHLKKKKSLLPINRFLLLGAGLGSALLRLQKVHKTFPNAVLVEHDFEILELGKHYFPLNENNNVEYVHADAETYLKNCEQTFDCIAIDLFDDLFNSDLIAQASFWKTLKKISEPKTRIILNSIFLKKNAILKFEKLIEKDFTFDRLDRKPNYIFVLRPKQNEQPNTDRTKKEHW